MCFAYFGDGKFLGWYADTSGSIRKNEPKVYGDSPEQRAIIEKNFKSKMARLNEKSTLGAIPGYAGLTIIDESLNDDKHELLKYKDVELRIVECPIYDGPNPDFDKVAYAKLVEEQHKQMVAEGIFIIPAPSIERSRAVMEFHKRVPTPECNNWIHADYKKVKEWASAEPTEFIATVKTS